MSELLFTIEGMQPLQEAASPHVSIRLRVEQTEPHPERIENVLLHVQVRIEPHLRTYRADERKRLYDLFGEEHRWARTLRSLLWTQVQCTLPRFHRITTFDLPIPCSQDFTVAAVRYFDGLEDGEIPLTLLFSGTVFHADDNGRIRVSPIPWESEASSRLPLRIWKDALRIHYGDKVWLPVGRAAFERLRELKQKSGAPSLEAAFERLCTASAADPGVRP